MKNNLVDMAATCLSFRSKRRLPNSLTLSEVLPRHCMKYTKDLRALYSERYVFLE
jgi:hypothetical protein